MTAGNRLIVLKVPRWPAPVSRRLAHWWRAALQDHLCSFTTLPTHRCRILRKISH